MLKKTNISQPQGSQNLSIAVFRGLNLTKHCNAQNKSTFPSPETHETLYCSKNSKFKESARGLAIDARILEFWEFLSIAVFREFQGWKFWNFLSIAVFRDVQNTHRCSF